MATGHCDALSENYLRDALADVDVGGTHLVAISWRWQGYLTSRLALDHSFGRQPVPRSLQLPELLPRACGTFAEITELVQQV